MKKYSVREKVSDNLVEQLLHNRGIKTKEDQLKFLSPDFKRDLHDPFLLPDMEKAAERIVAAIENNEMIGVWSDYDADGIPGGALLHNFFKLIGFSNFLNYIPDRHREGYGLNSEGIEEVAEKGVKLLITIDCGVRDVEEVEHACKLGMEVIITDHHEASTILPKALAIVNHKLPKSKYPENVLCGTGTVWKLIEAILQKRPQLLKPGQEKWLLDLVGIATLSDMVPLTGENRALAHFGLTVLRKTKRLGLRKLYSTLKISAPNLSEDDIGFSITPRINAASRMGHPRDAFNLLVAETESEAEALAKYLDGINNERKGVVAAIVKDIKKHVRERFESSGEKPVIVVGNPDWRPALLGLAANSVAEEFNRPVFLWGRENGEVIKGSCRSDGETDLVSLMERAKSHFLEFGGHKLSGGFSLLQEKVHTLEEALIEASTHIVKTEEEVLADAILRVADVNAVIAREINKLAPFGIGNEKPVFILENIIPEKISRFGKSSDHLSVTIRDGLHTTKAIAFFAEPDSFGDRLKEGIATNLVANLELSYFNGRSETRLRIVDFF